MRSGWGVLGSRCIAWRFPKWCRLAPRAHEMSQPTGDMQTIRAGPEIAGGDFCGAGILDMGETHANQCSSKLFGFKESLKESDTSVCTTFHRACQFVISLLWAS